MKTQIIRRLFLIAFALFICTNNEGSKLQSTSYKSVYNTASATNSKDANESKPNHDNQSKENPIPYIPDTHHDHDFDCFDFKHIEKRVFWRCIANKVFALMYHLTVLCALVSQFLIH
jgi:hypothetical protein